MTKILGFDIGVASIGWAFVERNSNGTGRIIKTGVRIIPSNKDELGVFRDFESGKSASFAKDRRQKKGIRRNVFRRNLRKKQLKNLLLQHGLLPVSAGKDLFGPLAIWELRSKAAQEQIELSEIGLVLLHLNNRRGFKSNRKSVSDEESDSNWLKAVSENSTALSKNKTTVGALHLVKLKSDALYTTKNRIFKRSDYEKEFETIWATQAKYYPEVLTDDLKLKIGDYTIFYQRPLKSAKRLLNNCRYEKHHKVSPRSSPLFQYFRGYEKILNLRLTDQLGHEFVLSNENLKKLLALLSEPKALDKYGNLTEAKIKKQFNLGKEYDCNFDKIEGNRTAIAIHKALENNGVDATKWMQFDPTASGDNSFDKQPLFRLWHALYSIEDESDLRKLLTEKFEFDLDTARDLMAIKLEPDYGGLSARAMRRILKEFIHFPENATHGVIAAGYKPTDTETLEERDKRELKSKLEHLKKGALRNPVVEKVLNQLVSITNAILEHPDMGRPDEIRVELARELKNNAKKRKSIEEGIRKANRENDEIREVLRSDFGIKKPSRRDIIRYRCWLEQGHRCLYSGEMIPRNLLFAGEAYELDHIIPRARMYNDSRANLVIVKSSENKAKDAMTAHDYMKAKGDEIYKQYLSRVKGLYEDGKTKKGLNPGINWSKREFLMMPAKDIPNDFIDRQLRESQYIVKASMTLLRDVCKNVTSTTGSITDLLRHYWGIDGIFQQIQLAKYRQWGKTYIEQEDERTKGQEKIENWSKRNDHRHHAMDAIVVACTTQSFIQRLNNLSKYYDEDYEGLRTTLKKFGLPWESFLKETQQALEGIVISFRNRRRVATPSRNLLKTNKGKMRVSQLTPRGPLHLETVYGKRRVDNGTKVKLNKKFGVLQAEQIVNSALRRVVLERLQLHNNDAEKAFKDLKKQPLLFNDQPVYEVHVYDVIFTTKARLDKSFKDVNAIVDADVREAVKKHLAEHDNDFTKAFQDLESNPVWYNEEERIPIKKLNIRARAEDLTPVRQKANGEPKDYVFTRNNHHIAIYRNNEGKLIEHVVSFWEAFERLRNGDAIVQVIHANGDELVLNLSINDLVLIDLPTDLDLNKADLNELSPYLYRVQKLTSGDVFFRHHHESTLDNAEALVRITSLEQLASRLIKVEHTILGELKI